MNKARRQTIDEIVNDLNEIKDRMETLKGEEQEAFDNLPESLQSSEKAEPIERAIDSLEEAGEDADTIIEHLENAKGD